MEKMKPLNGYVIVEVEKGEKQTASGIILRTDAGQKNKSFYGVRAKVLEVADDVKEVKNNDTILINIYDAIPFIDYDYTDRDVQSIKEKAILAICQP